MLTTIHQALTQREALLLATQMATALTTKAVYEATLKLAHLQGKFGDAATVMAGDVTYEAIAPLLAQAEALSATEREVA